MQDNCICRGSKIERTVFWTDASNVSLQPHGSEFSSSITVLHINISMKRERENISGKTYSCISLLTLQPTKNLLRASQYSLRLLIISQGNISFKIAWNQTVDQLKHSCNCVVVHSSKIFLSDERQEQISGIPVFYLLALLNSFDQNRLKPFCPPFLSRGKGAGLGCCGQWERQGREGSKSP